MEPKTACNKIKSLWCVWGRTGIIILHWNSSVRNEVRRKPFGSICAPPRPTGAGMWMWIHARTVNCNERLWWPIQSDLTAPGGESTAREWCYSSLQSTVVTGI